MAILTDTLIGTDGLPQVVNLPPEFIVICAALVITMQLGFAALECGLVDSKNAVSVLYKNTLDFCFGSLTFLLVWTTFYDGALSSAADLIYTTTFAITSATICSGALAGRIRLGPYVALSIFITAIVYPLEMDFLWGDLRAHLPTLKNGIFFDMAGSVVVHAVGGFSALAAAFFVGPRYSVAQRDRVNDISDPDKVRDPIQPHSIPLASIGMGGCD